MSIESTLRTYILTDNAALTDKISTRLYYQRAPQEVLKPYVIYFVLADPNTKTLVGSDGADPTISFRIVATTSADIIIISDAIRAKIIDYTGLIDTIDIYRIECENIRDFPPQADNDFYERYCDYKIAYER